MKKLVVSLFITLLAFPTLYAQTVESSTPPPPTEKPRFNAEAELRFRLEVRNNRDFDFDADDNLEYILTRARVMLTFAANPDLVAYFQPQFSGAWGAPAGDVNPAGTILPGIITSGALTDPGLNIHQAYVHWRFCPGFSLLLGRQEISYGDHVMIGNVGFANVGRSFDALRLRTEKEAFKSELFYSRIAEDSFSAAAFRGDDDFAGIYNEFFKVPGFKVVDGYVLWLHTDRSSAPLIYNFATIGSRFVAKSDPWIIKGEAALQAGEASRVPMLAYMGIIEAGYKLPWLKGFELTGEYNHASGDRSSRTFNRFHQLFPTGHKFHGFLDFFGRQNIQSVVAHAKAKFNDQWSSQIDIHSFWRVERQDRVYGLANDVPLPGQSATPANESLHIGEEIDWLTDYYPMKGVGLRAMVGALLPAAYLKSSLGSEASYFAYLQSTFSF